MASSEVDVYVKLQTGRTITTQFSKTEAVQKIVDYVAAEEKVPSDRVRLKYQGKVLKAHLTIAYLGIRPETILKGEIIVPKEICVLVKLPDGKCIAVPGIMNVSKVKDIQKSLNDTEGIPTNKQTLKFGGRVLDNAQLVMDSGITDEAIIDLTVTEEEVITETSPSASAAAATNDEVIADDKKEAIMSSFNTEGRNVEVVFSFDTTGSMASCLQEVRTKLKDSCSRLLRDIPNLMIGIIAHGDYCDYNNYVVRYEDLTSNTDDLLRFVSDVPSTGGGDSPECYEWALKKAQQLDWSEESAKALVVIGDCEPHPPSYTDQNIYWRDELDVLTGMGVKVYGVKAQSQSGSAMKFYEELADVSGGCFLSLKHFGVITDMFLAVCYMQSDPQQFDTFADELESEGKMVEDTKTFMDQLKNKQTETKTESSTKRTKRTGTCEAWWDRSHDTNQSPQYKYDQAKDSWTPFTHSTSTIGPSSSWSSSSHRSRPTSSATSSDPTSSSYVSVHRRKPKKTCVVS